MALKDEFRKWYSGKNRIVRVQQGDDNLIVAMFFNCGKGKYEIGVYRQTDSDSFMLIEKRTDMSRGEATNKFNGVVREF